MQCWQATCFSDIIKDISGSRNGNLHEYGLAESMNIENVNIKLNSLKAKWEIHAPIFITVFLVSVRVF